MKIDLYAAGYCLDNGKPTQRAAAGLVLATARSIRQIASPLGNVTAPQAELLASIAALLAVRSRHRKGCVSAYLPPYAVRLLERHGDGYAAEPKSNVQLVRRLRALVAEFPQLAILTIRDGRYAQAMELAKTAARAQESYDSGTKEDENG